MTQHSARIGLRSKEVTHKLTDTDLEWHGQGASGSVRIAMLGRFNVEAYSADIVDPEVIHGLLRIRKKAGDRMEMRSHHLASLGSYECQQTTYAPFVRELSRRVTEANPDAHFTTGPSLERAIYPGMTICLALLALALTLAWIGGGWAFDVALGWTLAVGAASFSWKKFKEAKPAQYAPLNVPDSLLHLRPTSKNVGQSA